MVKKINFIIITLALLLLTIPFNTAHAESTTIGVDPPTSTVEVGKTFTINITVTNVTDLYVWEFQLWYVNTILNCTNVMEGPFLKQGGTTFFVSLISNAYNATHGWLLAGSTLIRDVPGVNGSGVLANVTFQALAGGDTTLHLIVTTFKDSSPPPGHPIPHTTVDGTVHVTSAHDLAVTAITRLKTIVGQTYTSKINVTTQNQGGYTESFNLTLYASTIVIDTIKNIVLENATSKTVAFTWNTTGFAKGNYTISAYAWPLPGETDTADNNFTDGWVIVAMTGDITGLDGWPDGKCDMKDVRAVAKLFGVSWPEPWYNPNCDINDDLKIDMKDVRAVAKNFGKTDP